MNDERAQLYAMELELASSVDASKQGPLKIDSGNKYWSFAAPRPIRSSFRPELSQASTRRFAASSSVTSPFETQASGTTPNPCDTHLPHHPAALLSYRHPIRRGERANLNLAEDSCDQFGVFLLPALVRSNLGQ